MKKQVANLILLLFLVVCKTSYTQNDSKTTDAGNISPLFQSDAILPVELSYTIRDLKKETNDSTYIDSQLKYFENDQWRTMDVELRVRGNFRLKTCYFPPLKIKIKKGERKNTIFEDDKKLKVVMPCLNGSGNNDNVVKEFLAYKIYEIICPYHFNTRLIDVKLVEQLKNRTREHEVKGFLIEDIDNVMERHGGKEVTRKVHPLAQDALNSIRNELFQYMIGNTDFSTAYSHNQKLMYLEGPIIPIPYDFDLCGLVDPSYGVVSQVGKDPLPIDKVTDRYYRGFNRGDEYFKKVREEFLDKKSDIFEMMNQYKTYFENERTFDKAREFLVQFYAILHDEQSYERQIVSRARDN